MGFYRNPIFIISNPKVQFTIFPENTPRYNSGAKFQTIKLTQRAFNSFGTYISDLHIMKTIFQKVLQIKSIALFQFRYIDGPRKIIG